MPDPTPDELLKAYVRIFKQLPRITAAELLVQMGEDDAFAPSSQIMQAALLTVAGNGLFGAPENGTPSAQGDLIVAAARALWEREFSTYEECSHTWSEMPRIAAVALEAAGLAEPAPTRWAYGQAVRALEKHRARADEAETEVERLRAELADIRERHHIVPRIPEGNYPYKGVLDAAVEAARVNCWKRPGHGVHYRECCVRAALAVALTPDPVRDLWEPERDRIRREWDRAIYRWHMEAQTLFKLRQAVETVAGQAGQRAEELFAARDRAPIGDRRRGRFELAANELKGVAKALRDALATVKQTREGDGAIAWVVVEHGSAGPYVHSGWHARREDAVRDRDQANESADTGGIPVHFTVAALLDEQAGASDG